MSHSLPVMRYAVNSLGWIFKRKISVIEINLFICWMRHWWGNWRRRRSLILIWSGEIRE